MFQIWKNVSLRFKNIDINLVLWEILNIFFYALRLEREDIFSYVICRIIINSSWFIAKYINLTRSFRIEINKAILKNREAFY